MSTDDRHFMELDELRDRLNRGARVVLVDVRSSKEYEAGHVEGAVNIPADDLPSRMSELPSDATIVTICNLGGQRSCGAADCLKELGHDAVPLRGGNRGWRGPKA